MEVLHGGLRALSLEDRQLAESWLFEFDRDWHDGRLAERVRKLPPPGDPLRLPALVEMVKIDLERHWQHGRQACVEGYLRSYPELGTIDTAPADLILKEYEVRQAAGDAPRETTFMKRFPQQAEQLRPLLEQAMQSKETPRSNSPLQGTAPGSGVGADLPEQFGRYLIRRRLGQGGMGSV